MSSTLPWYKRDVDAWRGGTRGLPLELRGFYSELLDAMWDAQGPIPNNDAKLAMMVNCNKRTVRKLLPHLIALGKIIAVEGGLMNGRMQREIFASTSRAVRAPFDPNSTRIRAEFDRKNPKNPMFSTRALEEELRKKTKNDFALQKVQEEARAYAESLERAEQGRLCQ